MDTETGKPYFVTVDGVQVFSGDFVFQQMSAQGRSIDRARTIAIISVITSLASLLLSALILCS